MRRSRTVLLVVTAVAVLSGAGASSASAIQPEIGKCEAAPGGRFRDSGCTVPARKVHGTYNGSFEWVRWEQQANLEPAALVGGMKFQTAAGKKIECSSSGPATYMRFAGPSSVRTPYWELEGCQSEGQECESNLASTRGEINNFYAWFEEPAEEGGPIPGWDAHLGSITRGDSPSVGISYTVRNGERAFEPIVCQGTVGTVWLGGTAKDGHDSFISTITPVNKMTDEFTETFSESAPGVQSPDKLVGRPKEALQALVENRWEPVAISGGFAEHVEGRELEIKATR